MLRKTVLVRALSIAFSTAAMTAAVTSPVMAQSNATGNILGRVDNPAGASISLVNTDTGLKRSASIDASGRYVVTALPVGHYKVDLVRGTEVSKSTEVDVVAGQGADASFGAVQSVQVTGRRSRIDVSNTNNGAVFTAKEMERLPIAANLTSIALLAPNTTRGDAAYGGASFGGSGVSENAFYVNGFPITNPLTQLGSMELPFGAIAQASVITGGFGAEFGRSIGGVMSLTTKSGTNSWEVGAKYSIAPDQLRSKTVNTYYGNTGYADNLTTTDGKLHFRNDNNYTNTETLGAYVGGPLIKDKLFMFAAVEQTITRRGFVDSSTADTNIANAGWNQRRNVQDRYAVKLDWNLTDNHRLEFTGLGDDQVEKRQAYGYVLNPANPNAKAELDGVRNDALYSELSTRNPGSSGAQVNALKYTGNLTDDLTLTSMYGVLTAKRGVTYTGSTTGLPPSIVVPGVSSRVPALDAQNLYRNYNKFFSLPAQPNLTVPGEDKVKSFRLDVEYKLGDHTLRAGLDENKIEAANAGQLIAGGSRWSYRKVAAGKEFVPQTLSNGRLGVVGDFGGFGTQGYYARQRMFSSVTDAKADQSAQYLEDKYQVTKNLLVTAGVRNEAYSNSNGDGEKFINMKHQIAPRLAASWDVNGDASLKVYGSAGRYYLQLPTQVAARAASRSTLTDQDFTYTGIDPNTGAPTGLRAINTAGSPDGEWGTAKDPRSVVAKDLKPNYQDELTLGFEKAYSPDLNFGAKVTLRKLGAGIDDNCDTRRMFVKAQELGIEVHSKDFMNCFIFNPGEAATIWIGAHDSQGQPIDSPKAQYVTFSAADLGFPKAERSYRALDMFLEHPFRGGWYGKVNYTLSRSYGNMEGQTRSDTGQTDVATSAAWDFPEFTAYGSGLLPNDRKHQLKAYGFYELTPEFSVGASLLVQSGRPKTCLGTNEAAEAGELDPFGDQGGPGYGAEYYWCAGKPAPRGSLGNMPWEKQLDLSLMYRPAALKGLSFKVDVFNVANAQQPTARQETYDDGGGQIVLANYGENRTTQAPRFAKFSVEFNHKF
jgi:hypothetical protein